MHTNRQKCRSLLKLTALLSIMSLSFTGCRVYTINKSDLENELMPKEGEIKGLSLNSIYRKQFKNNIDTLECLDESGAVILKRINYDSRITIVTRKNKSIKYYAKTLYIYKNEFLIGERTAPKLRGPNYFPVKLSDISRIEVVGF
jgi:hypothetical protein